MGDSEIERDVNRRMSADAASPRAAAIIVPALIAGGVAAASLAIPDALCSPAVVAPIAAIAALAAKALLEPRASASGCANAAPATAAPTPDAGRAQLELLRRATEIRCDERTALLESMQDAVLLVDSHGETLYANHAATRLLGAEACVPGTRGAIAALPGAVARAVSAVVAAGGVERRRLECELAGRDPTPLLVQVVGIGAVRDGLAAVHLRDVRAEREADQMKREFVSKASHELRTPLSALRGSAELLVDGEAGDAQEQRELAGIILAETTRLESLVTTMLDIDRIEAGISRAELAETDLAELAANCVVEQQPEALRRRISLTLARGERGATALADRTLMKQVLLNLISNALKYTPEGGAVAVEVSTDNLARAVVVSVRDNGIGIPANALPELFGKFYRVENNRHFAKGTGLGLNLCRNIVETLHGGQIGVDSQCGAGSRFWFAIPMEQAGRKAA